MLRDRDGINRFTGRKNIPGFPSKEEQVPPAPKSIHEQLLAIAEQGGFSSVDEAEPHRLYRNRFSTSGPRELTFDEILAEKDAGYTQRPLLRYPTSRQRAKNPGIFSDRRAAS